MNHTHIIYAPEPVQHRGLENLQEILLGTFPQRPRDSFKVPLALFFMIMFCLNGKAN
ncbi:hypothetical protein WAI453_011887 [Rhynchosporium graminicola]